MEAHKTPKGRGFLPALRWLKAFLSKIVSLRSAFVSQALQQLLLIQSWCDLVAFDFGIEGRKLETKQLGRTGLTTGGPPKSSANEIDFELSHFVIQARPALDIYRNFHRKRLNLAQKLKHGLS